MLILVLVFILFIFILFSHRKECWDYSGYNYPEENPNALIQGINISGTVYTINQDSPGLGWVL